MRLGVDSIASIAGTYVRVTQGSYTDQRSPQFSQSENIQLTGPSSRVRHSDGVRSISGSISFDLTNEASGIVSLFRSASRATPFEIIAGGGGRFFRFQDCLFDSFQLQGSEGSLISGTISFVTPTEIESSASASPDLSAEVFVPFWQTGATDLMSWSISVSQSLTPRYWNEIAVLPHYYLCNHISSTLSFQRRSEHTDDEVTFVLRVSAGSSYTVTALTTSRGFHFGGQGTWSEWNWELGDFSTTPTDTPIT